MVGGAAATTRVAGTRKWWRGPRWGAPGGERGRGPGLGSGGGGLRAGDPRVRVLQELWAQLGGCRARGCRVPALRAEVPAVKGRFGVWGGGPPP